MAAETTSTTLTETVNSEYISPEIQSYAIANFVAVQLSWVMDLAGRATKTWAQPVWVKDAATASLSEPTNMSNTALETTEATITVAECGILRQLTKFAARTSMVADLEDVIIEEGGKLCAEQMEDSLVGQFSNASASLGQSTTNLANTDVIEGVTALRILDARGMPVMVLHPRQSGDLMLDSEAATGIVYGRDGTQSVLNSSIGDDGYSGAVFGVNTWHSSLCDTANTGADRVGALFINGNPALGGNHAHAAYGTAVLWMAEAQVEPDVANSSVKIAITNCFGTGELLDNSTQSVISDA